MEIITALLQESDKFMILAARLSGLGLAPIYNARNVPALWKVGLIMVISFFAWQLGLAGNYQTPAEILAFVLLLFSEAAIGIVLSLVAQFFFAAIQLAGQIIDNQMGFGIMNVVDPLSGAQAPMIGNFKYILAMLVYLQIDGHHVFMEALFDTYKVIPIGQLTMQGPLMQALLDFFGDVFAIGLKLSLPILGTLLVTDVIMGIMSRTVPQMNIFMVGMPLKIILGFGVLLVTMPLYLYLMNSLIEKVFRQIYQIIRLLI